MGKQSVTDDVTVDRIRNHVLEGVNAESRRIEAEPDPFWQALRNTGTELWLDTGDIDEASAIWTSEMSALTTNNTLLNREIQKGIYDGFIKSSQPVVSDLDRRRQVVEIAFMLNARHGLRLVQRFGGMVSVELHTDLAHDFEGILAYGRRYYDICPSNFIIKVPLTATGLLGARALREKGIPVNFTLEFSARQNALVAVVAKPNYLNVFLGRLNAYVADNGLGDGLMVGERATISSRNAVAELTASHDTPTKQIAASMRSADQLETLAGVDVFTIPVKVAKQGRETLKGAFTSRTGESYPVTLADGVTEKSTRIDVLWDVPDEVVAFAREIDESVPATGVELIDRAHDARLGDMFPRMTAAEMAAVSSDGKIPVHDRWAPRIRNGELAIDTLLNLAGLASFTADQRALDDRIEGLIS